MTSNARAAKEAKSEANGLAELISQAQSLSARVAKLPDGPRKQRLQSALEEMQAIADELVSGSELTPHEETQERPVRLRRS